MSRWGILARSTAYALPDTSRPSANVSGLVASSIALSSTSGLKPTTSLVEVGDLDADDVLARDRRLDPDRAGGEGHRQVVGQGLDARHLDVMLGADLVLGHDRARVDRHDLGRDREAAAASPRSAACSSSWSTPAPTRPAGRGSSSSMLGQDPVDRARATRARSAPIPSRPPRPAGPHAAAVASGGQRPPPDPPSSGPVQTVWLTGAWLGPGAGSSRMLRAAGEVVAGSPSARATGSRGRRPSHLAASAVAAAAAGFGRSRRRRPARIEAAVVEPTQRAATGNGAISSRSCRLNASISPRIRRSQRAARTCPGR